MQPTDEWAQCAAEMVAVHTETRGGTPQVITIGRRRYTGIVSAIDASAVPIDGGWDFSGGFTAQIPLSQFTRGLPGKNSVVKYGGHTLYAFSVDTINAMVEIIAANTAT
jgi:hypothetical protein